MSTVALKKVACDVVEGVYVSRTTVRGVTGSVPWLDREFPVSFSHVYLFLLIRK
jgi:hypothetical protein